MPIYEYRCPECKEKFEIIVHSIKNPQEIACPKCGGREVEKLFSTFGLRTSGTAGEPVCPTCVPRR
jgi:putative FmdB family regulatory protein